MLIYATPADLTAWTGAAAPTNAVQLLRSASLLVQEATNNAYYDTPPAVGQSSGSYNYYRPDALPSDPTVAGVLRDATCIQAAAWAALGIDPTLAGVVKSSVASQKHIGTASITYADAATSAAAKTLAATQLVPEAMRLLRQAHLISTLVWMW